MSEVSDGPEVSQPQPVERPALPYVAGCTLLLWVLLGGSVLWIITSLRCPPGGGMCGIGVVGLAYLLGLATFFASAAVGLCAVAVAWIRDDRVSAAGLGLVAALGLFAMYALYLNGQSGHPVVKAGYGFSPSEFDSQHPFGLPGSVALVVLMPVAALAFGAAPTGMRRAAALASTLTAVGLLVAIRVTP